MSAKQLPKHRANVYVVVRETLDVTGVFANPVVVGVFEHYTDADEYSLSCLQQWVDKGIRPGNVRFNVQLSTFYG